MSRRAADPRVAALAIFCICSGSLFGLAPLAHAQSTLGPNLISNPSFESGTTLPTSWQKGGYGTNTRTLTYPATPAHTGSKAAKVAITSYTSGDAKWFFGQIPVTAGARYQFSDWYIANVPTEVDVEVTHSNGSKSYIVLGNPAASGSYSQFKADFVAPAGATSVTVYHVVARVGTLTVDDYSLNRVTESSGNLVANGAFEMSETGGVPIGWGKGGWGSNSRTFSYPVAGAQGNGARVSIGSYTSGDAKWFFDPVVVSPGIYRYTNSYQATVPSMLTVQFEHTNGSISFLDIATLPSSSGFRSTSVDFTVNSDVRKVTVFHLIKQTGTLTIDNVRLARAPTTGIFNTGAVTLTFDDGWLSQYQNAVPKLNQYGFKGTFYITSRKLSDFGFVGYMSKAQVQDIFADGMEIGSHTRTHPDLTQLSSTQLQSETSGAKQDLLAFNVGPINSFAYPFGAYNSAVITAVKNAGHSNARTTNGGFATPSSPLYELPRIRVINTTTVAELKKAIDDAALSHSWLILVFHKIDTSGNVSAMTPTNFNAVIDYLNQKGIPVVTIQQGIQSL